MSKLIRTRQFPSGVWVVPEEQVKEFTKAGGPDYNKLINDCLNEYDNPSNSQDKKKPKKK